MTRLRSYLDTTLRVIHINRFSSLPSGAVESVRRQFQTWETSAPMRREFLLWHIEMEHENSTELLKVISLEYHHYLQGLFYPFLYYLSWLELDNLIFLGCELKSSLIDVFAIGQVHMDEDFFRNFNFM